MARRKYEFRPDPMGYDVAGKLYLTSLQRRAILKWGLYSLLCVLGLVLQDTMLSRLRVLGGIIELAPALLVLICVMEGSHNGSLFALLGSLFYVFSGTGQDRYCILFLTVAAILAATIRQSYLRRGFGSDVMCTGLAMLLYELCVFGMGLFLELTHSGRLGAFAMTALLSTLAAAALYVPVRKIGTLGGNIWKE